MLRATRSCMSSSNTCISLAQSCRRGDKQLRPPSPHRYTPFFPTTAEEYSIAVAGAVVYVMFAVLVTILLINLVRVCVCAVVFL